MFCVIFVDWKKNMFTLSVNEAAHSRIEAEEICARQCPSMLAICISKEMIHKHHYKRFTHVQCARHPGAEGDDSLNEMAGQAACCKEPHMVVKESEPNSARATASKSCSGGTR